MQGRKDYTEKLFTSFQLSSRVPKENLYCKLREMLDLSFLYKDTKDLYGKTGKLSIDPVGFFKLLLTGYLENITSDRKLLEHCSMRMTQITAEALFKLSVSYHSEDPRIKLREQIELSQQQFADLKKKLERLDNHSKYGAWTSKILLMIKDNPNLHTIGIAKLTGFEKEWLKLNIRKLKNLGLTISHSVGYELSPWGHRFIKNQVSEK